MDPKIFKRFRERYNITHKRLAIDLGVNESTLFRWEHGQVKPPKKLVILALKTLARHYQGLEAALRAPLAPYEEWQESRQTAQDQR